MLLSEFLLPEQNCGRYSWNLKLFCFLACGFFPKCTFLRLLHFISPTTYPMNSIFSVVLCIYKIHVFDEAFFLLAIVTIITKKMSFSYFHGNLRQGKIFSSSYARYNLDYPWKKLNQRDKVYWRKIVAKLYLLVHH